MGRHCEGEELAESEDGDLPDKLSDVFALLGNTNRRLALHCLADRPDQPISDAELADRIVALRGGEATVELDLIELQLRHKHLPKLEDAGVIDYDARSRVVVYRGDPILDCCLDEVEQYDPPLEP